MRTYFTTILIRKCVITYVMLSVSVSLFRWLQINYMFSWRIVVWSSGSPSTCYLVINIGDFLRRSYPRVRRSRLCIWISRSRERWRRARKINLCCLCSKPMERWVVFEVWWFARINVCGFVLVWRKILTTRRVRLRRDRWVGLGGSTPFGSGSNYSIFSQVGYFNVWNMSQFYTLGSVLI